MPEQFYCSSKTPELDDICKAINTIHKILGQKPTVWQRVKKWFLN